MAVSKPMQTEFGIHHRLESCAPHPSWNCKNVDNIFFGATILPSPSSVDNKPRTFAILVWVPPGPFKWILANETSLWKKENAKVDQHFFSCVFGQWINVAISTGSRRIWQLLIDHQGSCGNLSNSYSSTKEKGAQPHHVKLVPIFHSLQNQTTDFVLNRLLLWWSMVYFIMLDRGVSKW